MSKLKSRLPNNTPEIELEAFLTGIAVQAIEDTQPAIYPWQEAHIRADVTKVYNLRLSEAYLLKLKYIAEHTPDSMQKFCLNVLEKAIDDKINEIVK
jgi:hypothetical protein